MSTAIGRKELKAVHEVMRFASGIACMGPTPKFVVERLSEAERIVSEVATAIGSGTHGAYFEVSRNRYAHYFAAGLSVLAPGAMVLDVGNAPGHVGIGFSLMGYAVRGVNLNANWRETYPSKAWFESFDVVEHDIEKSRLPLEDNSFDAVLFTEVLEHVGITDPRVILKDLLRVLKPGGVMIFSTPNVCNISNVYALLKGRNVFWAPEIFYGSLDRHNREYTPDEADSLIVESGFERVASWGLNDHSNWRAGGSELATEYIRVYGDEQPMCRNTTTGVYRKAVLA